MPRNNDASPIMRFNKRGGMVESTSASTAQNRNGNGLAGLFGRASSLPRVTGARLSRYDQSQIDLQGLPRGIRSLSSSRTDRYWRSLSRIR